MILGENKKTIRWVFDGCQFRKRSISTKAALGLTDLLQGTLKNSVKKFAVRDSTAQDFADIIDIFAVDN